jgi:hypothetical protein
MDTDNAPARGPIAGPAVPTAAAPATPTARPGASIEAKAERSNWVAELEATLIDRYLIKRPAIAVGSLTLGQTEYRFKGDTSRVAFTESAFRLATDTNSPSVARSMVDVAQARSWKVLRVSRNEDFKRMVWLEASARGVKALGYEPNQGDLELLKREREARLVNRIEPAREAGTLASPTDSPSPRGSGGRKAVLAAIEAVLVAEGVPQKQRADVMAAAAEKLAQRMREGQAPQVKVYDRAAPSHRSMAMQTLDVQRQRDQPAPVR